jgi:1,4-dihydroxy-2-naphthoyl-CoA hydrolase
VIRSTLTDLGLLGFVQHELAEVPVGGDPVADGLAGDGPIGDDHQRIMDAYNLANEETLPGRMGIKIIEASPQRVVGTMPVAGNTQPYGLLHGGASCVLAESLGSLGSALHAGPGRVTVGIEISATHHRGAAHGEVTGVATLLHGGRSLTTYEIVITDDQGRRVCTSRLTSLLRDAVPGDGRPPARRP